MVLASAFSFAASISQSFTIYNFLISLALINRLITQDGHFVKSIFVVVKYLVLQIVLKLSCILS